MQCDFYKSPTLIRLMLVDGIIWVNKMNDLAGAHRWIVFISCAMESTQSIRDKYNKLCINKHYILYLDAHQIYYLVISTLYLLKPQIQLWIELGATILYKLTQHFVLWKLFQGWVSDDTTGDHKPAILLFISLQRHGSDIYSLNM